MKEQFLIKSERYETKKLVIALIAVGVLLSFFLLIGNMPRHMGHYDFCNLTYILHQGDENCADLDYGSAKCDQCMVVMNSGGKFGYALGQALIKDFFLNISPLVFWSVVAALIHFWLRSVELTVTDKRVYGYVGWGKRIDLPVDSVSAIGTVTLLGGIMVATPGGKISFRFIKNSDEIYEVLTDILLARQQKSLVEQAVKSVVDHARKTAEEDRSEANSSGRSKWVCKKCGCSNDISRTTCRDCDAYR